MNKGIRVTLIITAVFMMSGIAVGQRRSRPKPKPSPPAPASPITRAPARRPVTVKLKQGEPVTGNFLRADAETVEVEIQSGRLTVKMNEVASLVFTDEGEKPAEEERRDTAAPAADPSLPAARKAYAALRKLAEAAKIKLPLGQYGNLLIETKLVVEESLMEISEYALKNEIARAMEAYFDAGQAWGAAQLNDRIPVNSEPGATLMRKYQIKPGVDRLGQADHLELDTALKTIWAAAGARLNYVAALIRQ